VAADKRAHPNRLYGALALACGTYAVSQMLIYPALPDIERELHTNPAGATGVASAFFIAGAVTAGTVGRVGDMFGRQRVLLAQVILFGLGALLSALTPSLLLLLLGRVLMGTAASIFPLAFSIVRDEFSPERVPRAIALFSSILGLGAVLGLATGGLITDQFGFRWVFWMSFGASAIAAFAVWSFVPESRVKPGGQLDGVAVLLLSVGLACPLLAISRVPAWGWTGSQTLGLLAGGCAVIAAFAVRERRRTTPLFDLSELKEPQIALTNAATFALGFGSFGSTAILLQFFQEPRRTGYGHGATATQAAFFLVPGFLAILFTAPLAARLSARVGAKATFAVGTALSGLALAGLSVKHGSTFDLFFWPTLVVAGNGFAFAAMPTLILSAVTPLRSGEATGVNLIFRSVGQSLGTQFAATLITASIGASLLPTDRGFREAFAGMAIAVFVSFAICLAIPGSGRFSTHVAGEVDPAQASTTTSVPTTVTL
jgi:MFS family permease